MHIEKPPLTSNVKIKDTGRSLLYLHENDVIHGDVKSVRLPTNPETGKPKGFGYVEFTDIEAAKKAYEGVSGTEIDGRPVRLDYSQPRDNNGGGRGGRGGGRGGARSGAIAEPQGKKMTF